MNVSKLLATTALGISLGLGTAMADPVSGSFGAAGVGTAAAPLPIDVGSTFTFASAFTTSNGTGDLSGLTAPTTFTLSDFVASAAGTFAFNIPDWGSFTSFGPLVVTASGPAENRTVSVFADGIFTPDATNLPGFDEGDASVTFSANQTGTSPILSISANFTFSAINPTIPTEVPEPMSLALFGLGIAGLGAAMRRRNSARAAV